MDSSAFSQNQQTFGGVPPLRVHHVAARLRLPGRTVRWRAAKGLIPAKKVGRQWWFARVEIEALQAKAPGGH